MRIHLQIFTFIAFLILISAFQTERKQQETRIIRENPRFPYIGQIIYPDLTFPDSLGGVTMKGRIFIHSYINRNGKLIRFDVSRMKLWKDTLKSEIVYSLVPGEEKYKNQGRLNRYYPWIAEYMQEIKFIPDITNDILKGIDTIFISTTITLPKALKKKVDL